MNNKILLSILLPTTQKTYDIWVPADMTIHDATDLVCNLLEARAGSQFAATSTTSLVARESGDILSQNQTLKELGFVNGTQLTLV